MEEIKIKLRYSLFERLIKQLVEEKFHAEVKNFDLSSDTKILQVSKCDEKISMFIPLKIISRDDIEIFVLVKGSTANDALKNAYELKKQILKLKEGGML